MGSFDGIKQNTLNLQGAVLHWFPNASSGELDSAWSSSGKYVAHHVVPTQTTGYAFVGSASSARGFFPLVSAGHHHLHAGNTHWQYGRLKVTESHGFAHWTLLLDQHKTKALAPGEHVFERHNVIITDHFGDKFVKTITVHLVGKNDAPVIKSNGGGATATINLDENITAVTRVVGRDADHHDKLKFSIVGGLDAAKFHIDPHTGALTFVAAPDFEHPADSDGDNVYEVTVRVKDRHGGSDTQVIKVHVHNTDEAPHITSNGGGATAAIDVFENELSVTTVAATDPEGAAVTYSFGGGADDDLFTIDPTTGELKFNAPPDFELKGDADSNNVYKVIVKATDATGHSSTQAINITIKDVDEAPEISSDGGGATAAIAFAENDHVAVTTVVATDPEGAAVTYSLSGGDDKDLFTIDPSTGELKFIDAPDFEHPLDADQNNTYIVIVQASDGSHSSTQTITVTVGDVDEPPEITSNGGGASAEISLYENLSIVTTVVATDPEGATILYTLDGADKDLFTIGSDGVLKFITAPDFDDPTDQGGNNVYDVTVRASDGTHTTTQALAIAVLDAAGSLTWEFGPGVTPDDLAIIVHFTGGGAKIGVDWDDGDTDESAYFGGGLNHFDINHVYAAGDSWTATITALDDADPVGTAETFHVQTAASGGETLTGVAGRNVLIGNDGADVLVGGTDNDLLKGGGGGDDLTGGAGNDILVGGAGADTFHFDADFGKDLIADFDPTADFLEVSTSVFADADALLDATEDVDGHAVITKGANSIVLDGVVKADLAAHQDHLLFV